MHDQQFGLFDPPPVKSKHRESFEQFDAENPHVYGLFCRFVAELVAAGHRNGSAYAIMHRIRWESDIATKTEDRAAGHRLKINNNHIAFYSRKYLQDHPSMEGFFRQRKLRSEDE